LVMVSMVQTCTVLEIELCVIMVETCTVLEIEVCVVIVIGVEVQTCTVLEIEVCVVIVIGVEVGTIIMEKHTCKSYHNVMPRRGLFPTI
jgi:hypothetical protein